MDEAAHDHSKHRRKSAKPLLPTPGALLRLAGQTIWASLADRIALAAAGCAFWGMIALFPAISTLISAIGLVLDPESIETQLHLLDDLLPAIAFDLIENRVHELLSHPRASLSTSLIVSSALTFLSSATGSKAMLAGIAIAYAVEDQRSFLHFQLVGILMTLAAVVGGVSTLMVLVALQPALSLLGLPVNTQHLVHTASLGFLILAFLIAVALLYRFGPMRARVRHRVVLPGSGLATLIWVAASMGLSYYVDHMTSFGATYGSLGAVAGVMLWLYATAYAVLLGAELNARIEAFQHGN